MLPESPAGTGRVLPARPEPGTGVWGRAGHSALSSGLAGLLLSQRRQSPPAPSPLRTSGQLQSEPDWGAELG